MTQYQHIETERDESVLRVRFVEGRLVDNQLLRELQEELVTLVADDTPPAVVVNFSGVEFCSTALINALLKVSRRLDAEGSRMRLCSLSPTVREAFQMLNLEGTVFQVYDDEHDAVAGLDGR